MTQSLMPFYMTLPSDASMELFPTNTPASWKTKLKKAVHLSGRWEVAIVELIYPNSLYNIPVDEVIICEQLVRIEERELVTERSSMKVPAGIYSVQDLVTKITDVMPKLIPFETSKSTNEQEEPAAMIRILSTDSKVRIKLRSTRVSFLFGSALHVKQMLGITGVKVSVEECTHFQDYMHTVHKVPPGMGFVDKMVLLSRGNDLDRSSFQYIAQKCVNMSAGSQNLFVYSSLVDFNIVGDDTLQLLRAVPIKVNSPRFEPVIERFDSAHYVPVLHNVFETVELTIATDTGLNAHFQTGKSLIKLHFRPQRSFQ